MAEPTSARRWVGRVIFPLLVAAIALVQLLPIRTTPTIFPMPDVILCLTCLWVARRPDLVPVWIVAGIFLLSDIFFQRPPGLMAGLVVILTEVLRRRASALRSMSFVAEWTIVGVGIVALTIANRSVLIIALADRAPLGPVMLQLMLTVMIYPALAFANMIAFGINRPGLGEVDAFGRPL